MVSSTLFPFTLRLAEGETRTFATPIDLATWAANEEATWTREGARFPKVSDTGVDLLAHLVGGPEFLKRAATNFDGADNSAAAKQLLKDAEYYAAPYTIASDSRRGRAVISRLENDPYGALAEVIAATKMIDRYEGGTASELAALLKRERARMGEALPTMQSAASCYRLRKVRIANFLSVKGQIEFDVDSRVSILLGANDHGKSNILKALLCLNADAPIRPEDVNWDAGANEVTRLDFMFALSPQEDQALKNVLANCFDAASVSDARGDLGDIDGPSEHEMYSRFAQYCWQPLGAHHLSLTLSRSGLGSDLRFLGMPLSEIPSHIAEYLRCRIPRVELFKASPEDLQDSVNADEIATTEFEFLQGVFYYAGLDPMLCRELFVQNDETTRGLQNASRTLDRNLRSLWGQGVDLNLEFELDHKEGRIEFLANDPAISRRKARMSKRSTGVTQFFRLSMVLHARTKKHPANSYIYLFDEPGVFLHPKGQKDLLQVFERLSDDAQILYTTHSLFMLNQNYPERHRLITRDASGTKVDQKPYKANWRRATDALGVYMGANILFNPTVLLVEGDSDPLYIYELFRQLNRLNFLDADANMLGILSYSDLANLRFLLQMFRGEQPAKVVVLFDGDSAGTRTLKAVKPLCEKIGATCIQLRENHSIEDYVIDRDAFLQAAVTSINVSAGFKGVEQRTTLDETKANWDAHAAKGKVTGGRWFSDFSKSVLKEPASKVALAREYCFQCREVVHVAQGLDVELDAAKEIVIKLCDALELPTLKADKNIQVRQAAR